MDLLEVLLFQQYYWKFVFAIFSYLAKNKSSSLSKVLWFKKKFENGMILTSWNILHKLPIAMFRITELKHKNDQVMDR